MKPNDAHFIEVLYVVFLAGCLVALSSCSHDPKLEREIEAGAQQQPVVAPGPLMQKEGEAAIEESPLSPKQKAALKEIAGRTSTDLKSLRDQEAKLRLLLVKQLVNPQASDREVEGIKKRILEVNQQNNKRWLKGLEEADRVIGRRSEQDAKFYRVFMENPIIGGEHE